MGNQKALTASNESFLRDLQLFCNIARGSFVAASTEMGCPYALATRGAGGF
jgi:LysR family transcriptional activator of dmlA